MRMTEADRFVIEARCPDGQLCRVGDAWVVVTQAPQARPDARWQGQVIDSVEPGGRIWWRGGVCAARSRAKVLELLRQEAT